jgi:hypothetical protein
MKALEVKRRAEAAGIQLTLAGDKVRARGDSDVVSKWLPVLHKHKEGIRAILTGSKRVQQKKFILGYACPCGCISYMPKTFQWKDIHGGKHWGFSCLNCETRYWFV